MYTIYALVDPRNNEIKYVGITTDVYKRFVQHMGDKTSSLDKKTWLQELKDAQIIFHMETLEQATSVDQALDREEYWIQHCISEGYQLFNKVLTRNHKHAMLTKELTRQKRGRKHSDQEVKTLIDQWKETGVMPEQWRKSHQMRSYIKRRYPKTYNSKLEQLGN